MKQFKPLPRTLKLEDTLSRRIRQLRELRNLTVLDLARLSRFSVDRLDGLESGLEGWMSASDRQLLAKALNVEPELLQEVESRPSADSLTKEVQDREIAAELAAKILEGERDLECPQCGGTLKCSYQDGLDIEGRPVCFAKAFCLKCPYVLRY